MPEEGLRRCSDGLSRRLAYGSANNEGEALLGGAFLLHVIAYDMIRLGNILAHGLLCGPVLLPNLFIALSAAPAAPSVGTGR